MLSEGRRKAKPDVHRRKENLARAMMRAQMRGHGYPQQRRWSEATYSRETLDDYRDIIGMLRESIPNVEEEGLEASLVAAVTKLVQEHEAQYKEFLAEISEAERDDPVSRAGLDDAEREVIRLFVENLKLLAGRERSDCFADLLQIDIFRHRPQLYEIWILCRVVSTIAAGGFDATLLEVVDDGHDGKRWELRYAKASRPIAQFRREKDEELFLFYQLFRDRGGGDMPDISMWSNSTAAGHAIWIVDPKFSEKGGYGARDYENTAERYRRKFRPRSFSTIVEYFARPGLSVSPSDAILDVRPGGAGIATLLQYLCKAHNLNPQCVAIIDLSASFETRLAAAAHELGVRQSAGLLSDQFITFAEQAEVRSGLAHALRDGGKALAALAGGGTEYAPLVKAMRAFQAEMGEDVRFVIVSDFGFNNGSEADLLGLGLDVETIRL